MKTFGQLLSELGFNASAPESVKRAIIESLQRFESVERKMDDFKKITSVQEQLSFNFEGLEAMSEPDSA